MLLKSKFIDIAIKGNEYADTAAKEATTLPLIAITNSTCTDINRYIKASIINDKINYIRNSSLIPIPKLSKT